MKNFEYYYEQLGQAAEEAFTRPDPESTGLTELLSVAANSKESKYKRAVALLSLIRNLLPLTENSKKNLEIFRNIDELPISSQAYNFKDKIGSGGENNVYLLESREPEKRASIVLKINHLLHGDADKLAEEAKIYKQEYERVKDIYKDVPGVVPEETFMIARDVRKFLSKKGRPAIVAMQKFFGTEVHDLFNEISYEELKRLMAREPEFADTLKKFAFDSLRHEEKTGEVIDFLGPKNLSVVKIGQTHRLVLLDPHVFYSTHSGNKEIDERLHKDLEYLKVLTQETEVEQLV